MITSSENEDTAHKNTPIVVGIAGKPGSGKNYLASLLQKTIGKKGYTSSETSYAKALKEDITLMLQMFRVGATDEALSFLMRTRPDEIHSLREILSESIKTPTTNGWSKNEELRRALQYYGTDVRRAQDDKYWLKKVAHEVETVNTDYLFVTDVRFPNEANQVLGFNGVLIHLNLPDEIITRQTIQRDGVNYSSEALTHIAENALKDYNKFTLVLETPTYDVETIFNEYIPVPQTRLENKKNTDIDIV